MKQYKVYLEPEQHLQLKLHAVRTNQSISAIVSKLIENYIQHNKDIATAPKPSDRFGTKGK